MSKGKKKVAITKKEEEQAQKVVKIVFVSLIILALIMLIAFSFSADKFTTNYTVNPDCLAIDRMNIKSNLC